MLSISDPRPNKTCEGYGRREFLRVGTLGMGLGMFGLEPLLRMAEAGSNGNGDGAVRKKSVVLLFLNGGPPHIEFFDPKMTAPSEYHSISGEVKTKIKGETFGGTFPKLAKMTDKLAVVRSFASGNGGHTYEKVSSGDNELKAAMGAVYARVVGINRQDTGMPTNTLILPEAVRPDLKLGRNFETNALPTMTDPGSLGATYRAFNPSGGGELQQDMQLRVTPKRLADRRLLLRQVDHIKRQADAGGALAGADKFHQQAFDVITGGVADAFDLSKEDPKVLARYNTTKLFDAKKLQRWGDMRRATNLLGHQMLLARRLCERGCGFVTVSDCGWDYHANNNSPKNMAGLWPMGGQVDHAVSAFLEDIHQRGLSDDILLIVTGEMGRSPKLNGGGGRDHYGSMTSLLVAGGGLKMGQIIGKSDHLAAKPATTPYGPKHLFGTILHTLFNVGELRVRDGLPRDLITVLEKAAGIPELF